MKTHLIGYLCGTRYHTVRTACGKRIPKDHVKSWRQHKQVTCKSCQQTIRLELTPPKQTGLAEIYSY